MVGIDPDEEEGPGAQTGPLLVDEGEQREVPEVHAVGDPPNEGQGTDREQPRQRRVLGARHAEEDSGRGERGKEEPSR